VTDLAQAGRSIIDSALYMVVATADRSGRPWPAPVYFAHRAYRELIWVSKPGAAHSRNIEARPEVGIVIFDTSVPINSGQGVYMSATAAELTGDDRHDALAAFSQRSIDHGGVAFGIEHVEPSARLRLYRAIADEQWVLDERDNRVAVSLYEAGRR
jgi:Pyridoxamine 5'-phosphate oxidase